MREQTITGERHVHDVITFKLKRKVFAPLSPADAHDHAFLLQNNTLSTLAKDHVGVAVNLNVKT